ncbi:MAG: DUF2232 domain-containing protein [Verrucomicrobiae bacterium]|nr:DUF2232 domain-containing protein [Verrucomicrobiae bacterium]
MTGALTARIFLLILVTAPIALTGFSYNAATALAAVIVGLLGVIGLFKLPAVFLYAMTAFPIAGLVYLALLKREDETGVEWYPVGRVIMAAAIVSGGLFGLTVVPLASDEAAFQTSIRTAVELAVKQGMAGLPPEAELKPEQLTQLTDILIIVLPAAGGAMVLFSLLGSLWLGAQVARAAGTLVRPWPDIAAFRFPAGAPILLAISTLGATWLEGPIQTLALSFAGAFFGAYVLLGLAVAHFTSRGAFWRTPALVALYVILIANPAVALLVAMLGVADSVFPFARAQRASPPDSPGGSAGRSGPP